MYRYFPNILTLTRLVMAAVFFVVLNQYRYTPRTNEWILLIAAGLFILAAITDLLDGYLARRWQVESTFGRIMDPFCDKVLVIGAFIYLAGSRFVSPAAVEQGYWATMMTGVYPWMVAIILARELLVTGVRDELEGRGVQFGASLSGKLKMLIQSFTVPTVLIVVYLDPARPGLEWAAWLRDFMVYATVIVTVASGVPYMLRATRGAGKEV